MKATRKSRNTQRRKHRKAKRTHRSARGKLRKAVNTLLPQSIFTDFLTHGNTQWTLGVLSFVALFWAFVSEPTLTDRFITAVDIATHWFPDQYIATSYRGFMKALVTHNATLVKAISAQLRARMLLLEQEQHQIAGLSPFVVDGSKVAAPWTKANEQTLGKKGRKPKGNTCKRTETDLRPQLTLTLLWHMELGLPWAWKHGGLADGERTQFRELLDQLPKAALVVADAGFVGYLLWQTIINSGRHFLIRVGGNVELLKDLQAVGDVERRGDIVWLWPDGKRTQNQPPLRLRLIQVQKGRQTWFLVTSLLDQEQLSDEQATRLYTRRWGVECCFRALKQTFERGKARSDTPECAGSELDWSLLSLWLINLLAKQELIAAQIAPDRSSAAEARRLVQRELRYQSTGEERMDVSEFQTAVKDDYHRTSSKKARHDQRKKRPPTPSAPTITAASREQRQAAKALARARTPAA
jgi:hypothetical protein